MTVPGLRRFLPLRLLLWTGLGLTGCSLCCHRYLRHRRRVQLCRLNLWVHYQTARTTVRTTGLPMATAEEMVAVTTEDRT